MKKYIVIILFFFAKISLAQEQIKNYDFSGTVTINDSIILPYHLIFTDSNKILAGYSITDKNGEYETESKIKGKINLDKKTLTIAETSLEKTKAKYEPKTFCYLNITLKIKKVFGKTILQGHGTYKNKQNGICGEADLYLIGTQDLLDGLEVAFNYINTNDKKDTLITKIVTEKKIDNVKSFNNLYSNEKSEFKWKSDTLVLEIWDDGKEDGDIITLKINNKIILYNYTIKNEKKIIRVFLPNKLNILTIKAENEGNIFPNTSKAILYDELQEHIIVTNIEKNKEVFIEISKE